MSLFLTVLLLFVAYSSGQQAFKCPESNGFFPDPYQCDLYYKCVKGQAEERLCPDGLVFNDANSSKERCDLPSNVDCGERKELQEPISSPGCPRANGYFPHKDPEICDKFYYCYDGKVSELPCPPGLYFDEDLGNCDWKEGTKRTTCNRLKKDILDDGFSCPEGDTVGPNGRVLPHPTFPHPEDCQKFYICRNGLVPQKGSCPENEVYNDNTFMCDKPENVPGCETFFGGQPGKNKV